MAGGARAAAQAPHPTHLPLSRLCTNRRVTKGDQEAAILSSVPGEEEENFIETLKRDGGTNKSNRAHGRLRPKKKKKNTEQARNATSCNQEAGWTRMPFCPLGAALQDYDSQNAVRRRRGRGG